MRTESEPQLALPFRIPVLRIFTLPFIRAEKRDVALLGILAAFLTVAGFMMQGNGAYDSDGWFLLATGKRIVEHGIPYTNPWSFSSYRPIVIQQWLHDVLLYGAYCLAGYDGAVIYQIVLSVVFCLSMCFAVTGFKSGRLPTHQMLFIIGLALFGAGIYICVRPTAWSMTCLCLTVGLCARWRRTSDWRHLVGLPLVTVLHVNVQAAMWPLDAFVAACFLLPETPAKLFDKSRNIIEALKETAPIYIAVFAMVMASVLNPYGIDGARYVIDSMGAASYGNVISEMKPAFEATKGFCMVFFAIGLLPIILTVWIRRKPIDPAMLLMLVVTLAAALLHWRNIWIFSLVSAITFASQLPRPATNKEPSKHSKTILLIVLLAVIGPISANAYVYATNGQMTCWESSEASASKLIDKVSDSDIYDPVVYAEDPVIYNYMEWKGLKVPFDLRPELWDDTGSKKTTSPYRDYVNSMKSAKKKAKYLAGNGFDFYLVSKKNASWYAKQLNLTRVSSSNTLVLLASRE